MKKAVRKDVAVIGIYTFLRRRPRPPSTSLTASPSLICLPQMTGLRISPRGSVLPWSPPGDDLLPHQGLVWLYLSPTVAWNCLRGEVEPDVALYGLGLAPVVPSRPTVAAVGNRVHPLTYSCDGWNRLETP